MELGEWRTSISPDGESIGERVEELDGEMAVAHM
jgi:hypothetical protein